MSSAVPSPPRDPKRRLLAWLVVTVVVALLIAGVAAADEFRDRGSSDVVVTEGVLGNRVVLPAVVRATRTPPTPASALPEAASSATASPSPGMVADGEATTSLSPPATIAPSPGAIASPSATSPSSEVTPAVLEPTPLPPETTVPGETPPTTVPTSELSMRVSAATLGVGETLALRVSGVGATSARVSFLGLSHPLVQESEETWFAVIGVPLGATVQEEGLLVVLRTDDGTVSAEGMRSVMVTAVERPVDRLTLTEEQGAILTADMAAEERAIRTEQFEQFDRARRWEGLFELPVQGAVTTEFGQGRSINGGPVTGQHSGTDIATAEGTPAHAAAAGRVSWVGEMPIRGNSVLVDHGAGVITGYHHLSEIAVSREQAVDRGAVLGAVGSTGLSTGPHLHWELTIYGVNVDPTTWLESDFTLTR